jgi:hypothetical protein
MSFKTAIATDYVTFLNATEHAESIRYTAKGASVKIINAVIERKRLEVSPQDGNRSLKKECEIYIANNATYGVAEVTKGVDKVSFAENIGGTDIDWLVLDVLDHDEGMWHLLVGK